MARKGRATYDDLKALPENVVGEILAGELVVSPRPSSPHAHASSLIGADLVGPFHRGPQGPGGPGGWWILDEPELHFHGDVVVPDLAGWRHARMPRMPRVAAFELAPDWVCEIVSERTGKHDRGAKAAIYAREGVPHYWLVDPADRLIEVRRLQNGAWVVVGTYEDDARARIEPFGEIELDIGRWWLPDDEPTTP